MTAYRFETVVLQTDVENSNERTYAKAAVEYAVEQANETIVPIVSETDDWGDARIPLDKIVGEIITAWMDEKGRLWVRGRINADAPSLEGMNRTRAIKIIQSLKLVPVGHGCVDPKGLILEGYRINGYLVSEASSDPEATTMRVTQVED